MFQQLVLMVLQPQLQVDLTEILVGSTGLLVALEESVFVRSKLLRDQLELLVVQLELQVAILELMVIQLKQLVVHGVLAEALGQMLVHLSQNFQNLRQVKSGQQAVLRLEYHFVYY